MKWISTLAAVCMVALFSTIPVALADGTSTTVSTDVTLPSTDNIWAAGLSSAPSGSPPAAIPVTPGAVVTLDNATGTWSCNSPWGGPGNQQGSDGNGVTGQNCDPPLDAAPSGGLSGIYDGSRDQFITGVFLASSGQPAVPPARLDFTDGTGLGHSFASLSPQLGQMFFIGDGLTGTGSGGVQQFVAPAGAATLYLGYTDGPTAYGDNQGAVSATVNVTPTATDTTPPTLTVPTSPLVVDATGPYGAVVTYTATATDPDEGPVTPACAPPSGWPFPIGDTTVTCTATDSHGNTAQQSFTVHVKGTAEQLTDLALAVEHVGPGRSFAEKITEISLALQSHQTSAALGGLGAFINEVAAQSGGMFLTVAKASDLTAAAKQIEAVLTLSAPIAAFAPTSDGLGYWEAGADGGVLAFGDARYLGSLAGSRLGAPVVAFAPTPDDKGYWLVTADGGVFAFGDAYYKGSLAGFGLSAPIAAFAPTPDGKGYWLVGADGGVFAFGDAYYKGSLGGYSLSAPIRSFAPTWDGKGYWLVGADGGVFAFGDAYYKGSLAGFGLSAPIVAFAPTWDDKGYWLVGADGGVFAFGDAHYEGSAP